MQQTTFRAMGSTIMVALDADTPRAIAALAAVPDWFAGWERIFSRFRTDSELSRLNRSHGRWMPVSQLLWELIEIAVTAARQSHGLVSPALLPALEAAGYTKSFIPDQPVAEVHPSKSASGPRVSLDYRGIRLNSHSRAVWLPPGLRIDLGGFAKGWAADQVVRRLARFGPVLVDAGGDIAVSGPRADDSPWPIAVDDPCHRSEQIDLIMLGEGGVATSGRDYRRWRQGDVERHHIIDPRSGAPANTDVLSATVIAPSVLAAELAAKAALILGSQAGLDYIATLENHTALLVLDNGQVLRDEAWAAHCWVTV